uniref:Ig-like domain-containing protein n=1 Tax=Gasterosteus aculeatus TaxID=69293 RepID=G3PU84_GASAC
MDGLHTFLVALLGVASCSHDWISGSVTVRPGDNITLYCDCKSSTGLYIVWYRNCSHENQPPLVLKGIYYCGTEEKKVEDKELIGRQTLYRNGNVTTRVLISPDCSDSLLQTPECLCPLCWTLLVSLCPAIAVLSSVLSSLLVYHLCQKKAPQPDQQTPQRRQHGDEDVCYAALEIQQTSHRPKKKIQSSDFSTYSAINTSRM